MAESAETLAGIQDQIAKCRRLAVEVRDREAAERLHRIADDLEQYLRSALTPHFPGIGTEPRRMG